MIKRLRIIAANGADGVEWEVTGIEESTGRYNLMEAFPNEKLKLWQTFKFPDRRPV